jgi:hypothetical protein
MHWVPQQLFLRTGPRGELYGGLRNIPPFAPDYRAAGLTEDMKGQWTWQQG